MRVDQGQLCTHELNTCVEKLILMIPSRGITHLPRRGGEWWADACCLSRQCNSITSHGYVDIKGTRFQVTVRMRGWWPLNSRRGFNVAVAVVKSTSVSPADLTILLVREGSGQGGREGVLH